MMTSVMAAIRGTSAGSVLVLVALVSGVFPARGASLQLVSLAVPCLPETGDCIPLNREGRDCRGLALFTSHDGLSGRTGTALPLCGYEPGPVAGPSGLIADEEGYESDTEQ